MSLGSSIYELASYAHALSADVVYEADDNTEFVWTNPKLQKQWIDLHNLMNQQIDLDKNYSEIFAKIDCIKKQLAEKQQTMHTIDSLHRAIHNEKIYAIQSKLNKINKQNTR